jgi:hypothetical protein
MSIEEIRTQAQRFQKKIRSRNIREYSAMVLLFVIAIPLGVFLRRFPLVLVGLGLCMAGTLVILYQFRKRAATRPFPAVMGSISCVEFYRQELERQRDAQLSVWSWYILPQVPGAAMLVIAMAFIPALGPVVALIYAVLFTIAFVVVGKLNKRAAHRLQQKIDELRQ